MSGRPVCRLMDFHFGHVCDGTDWHATPIIAGVSLSVFTNNKPTATFGSITVCGDIVLSGNFSVLVGGRPIARTGDITSGHFCMVPNPEDLVLAGAGIIPKSEVRNLCKNPKNWYHTSIMATGSLSVFA